MSQSGLMVAALIGGFIVFVAMQGKLANYWSILMGGGSTSTGSTATTPSTTSPTPTTPSTTSPSSTTPTFANPFSFLGGTANPIGVPGTVGYNATKPGAFSGLTAGSGSLFSGEGN